MFKTLLWKECKETRFLIFIMAAGTPLALLIIKGLDFSHNEILPFLYIIWIFFAILLAASQFTNKAASGTSELLVSRPVHWFKIWFIKTVYGICTLTVFGFYLILLSYFISPSLTEASSVFQILFVKTPSSTPPSALFIGIVLFTIILYLYFTGSIVSTNLKSSLKAVLVTFLVTGFIYYVMLSSSLLLNYTSSNYIFWIIFPVLIFVVFLKCQSDYYLIRVSYWILTIGGILFWIIFVIKSISLRLLSQNFSFFLSPRNPLFSLLLISFVISSILASIFAFGIFQKKYRAWFKSINCFNLLIMFTICTSAIIHEAIPKQNSLSAADFLSPIIFYHDEYFKIPLRYKGIFPGMEERVVHKYFIVNENNSEVHSFGHDKFMFKGFNISTESNWVYYACPTLRWGVYYKWGLWAENLITNRQYRLMTGINTATYEYIDEEWFDKGTRLIILDRDSNKKVLFSVKNGMLQKIKEEQEPGKSWLLHIDINNKLYFYNPMNRLISCYNQELIKEYKLSVVKDKMKEILSDYIQNKAPRHNKEITEIDLDYFTRERIVRKPSPNNDLLNIYFDKPEFMISPDGKYMIFYLVLMNIDFMTIESKSWCVSLPDGIYNEEFKQRNLPLHLYRWLPGTGRILATNPIPGLEKETEVIDLKNGISKNIIKDKFYFIQEKFPIEVSDKGTYILTCSSRNFPHAYSVNLYRLDSDTLTCSLVSSKADLASEKLGILDRWSPDHSQVVFLDGHSGNFWRLDLNKGKWSEIKCPFKYYNYRLLGVSNKGEVYLKPSNDSNIIRIYRLTDTDSKLIYESKPFQNMIANPPGDVGF